jgi:hypothetical protein
VSLLSVDGDVIRLGRDLDRLCRLVSLGLLLCCDTLDGLGLAVELGLRAFPLRVDLMVFLVEPAKGAGEGKP